jgi:hypothetical protein
MIFEKRAEAGPVDQMAPPFPRVSDIEGYIRACEDQTAQYDWSLQLLAVASRLGLPNSARLVRYWDQKLKWLSLFPSFFLPFFLTFSKDYYPTHC